jgi:hypothetical protein
MRERTTGTPSASPLKAMVYLGRAGFVLLLAMIRRMPEVPRREETRELAGAAAK